MKMKTGEQENHQDQDKHVQQSESNEISAVKNIDSLVFDHFKKLTSDEETIRINSSLYLLHHFTRLNSNEKKEKELQYALKRLIRGLGASTNISKTGFFTTFVGFLKLFLFNEIDVDKILSICKKELHVGKKISGKEDSDAIVGQILTCGAILRSNKILDISSENLKNMVEILISSSKHRNYHNSLAYSFILELIQSVNEKQFIESVWPLLEVELKEPWNKQTVNTLNCLITIISKFPNILSKKYLKTNFNGTQLLNEDSYKHLYKLFWENSMATIVVHPAFENFGKYIANCKTLEEFWTTIVNEKLSTVPNKLIEIRTLKVLTDVILNIDITNGNKTRISNLLTENFIKMMTTSFKNMKIKKEGTVKAFYDDFFEALKEYCSKVNNDGEKVEIIRKLILYPGTVNIERQIGNRIIHQILIHLKEEGVQQLYEIYKGIFLNKLTKNPNDEKDVWLNVERQNAGYMLQYLINHKSVQNSCEWKTEQLKLMMKLGLFCTNENGDVLDKANSKSANILSDEFALQIKNIFYTSLQSKLPKLKNKEEMLFDLAKTCNDVLRKKDFQKHLRSKIDEKLQKIWSQMYCDVEKSEKNKKNGDDKLQSVFRILLLHMGLQLFKEPEMAEAAILDLEKCMEKSKTKNKKGKNNEEEPEWIEVVTDLFLHLLSQNTTTLRTVVNSVFPHLCDKLTLTAVHQILSVLNMKDGNNPLSEDNNEEEDEEKMNGEGNNESDADDSIDEIEKDDINDADEDEDDEEDEDDDEIMEKEENTVTDVLRNAVSLALGAAAPRDDDQDSIDVNDIDEEEGNRLNEALANAFRLIKNSNNDNNKRSKGYRVKTTTLMHFRVRVLDLIEIYIQHNPKMLITVEIMLSLYNMIEFCIDKELKPLTQKLEKVLNKLTSLKHFMPTEDDVNNKNLCDYLRLVIEKKVKAPVFDMHNKFKAKCCTFLISCSRMLTEGNNSQQKSKHAEQIVDLLKEYLDDFIKSRNPVVSVTLLTDIFKMRWQGTWQLVKILTSTGLSETTRTFRRIQVLELLGVAYDNHEFIRQDLKASKKYLKIIETHLQNYLSTLSQKSEISVREFSSILDVFYSMNRCHCKTSVDSCIDKEKICNDVQNTRRKLKLENVHSYTRFCNVFNLKPIKNAELNHNLANTIQNIENDNIPTIHVDEDDQEHKNHGATKQQSKANKNRKNSVNHMESSNTVATTVAGIKRKKHEIDYKKEKKLKKEERARIASEGLNGNISFVNFSNNDVVDE